jgi:trehalose 6-phosphate phosphatase
MASDIVGVPSLAYVGNHGLEILEPASDTVLIDRRARAWIPAIQSLFAQLSVDPATTELEFEDKGPIGAFHWRSALNKSTAVSTAQDIARNAADAGLGVHWGRQVLEVRPPFPFHKGLAVKRLLQRGIFERCLYMGDDQTDLDAFGALRQLHISKRVGEVICIAVHSSEVPIDLLQGADFVVADVAAAIDLLAWLRIRPGPITQDGSSVLA